MNCKIDFQSRAHFRQFTELRTACVNYLIILLLPFLFYYCVYNFFWQYEDNYFVFGIFLPSKLIKSFILCIFLFLCLCLNQSMDWISFCASLNNDISWKSIMFIHSKLISLRNDDFSIFEMLGKIDFVDNNCTMTHCIFG